MFDFVRNNQRMLQFGLMLLIVPSFVAFGIQGYQRFNETGDVVAEVAGTKIHQGEWDSVHRNQIERMRAQAPNVDVKLLDTPESRQRVLDDMVRERVLRAAADKLHLLPTEQHLLAVFQNDQQFAQLRNEDGSVRKELLALRGMSSEQFAAQIRQDLAMQQVLGGIAGSAFAPAGIANQSVNAMFQRRELQVVRFETKNYLAKAEASEAELQAWYDDAKNAARLQSPETVSIEYVVLDLDAVQKSVSVPEDDLRKYYSENAARYTQPEERQARHILVKVEPNAPADVKAKARAKIEGLLAELKKNRAGFAELAKKNSDDPGSAAQGGDLGWFGRGAMTGPFDEVSFKLKKGELSDIIETDFGLHILEVTDARGGAQRSFESVRGEMETEVRKQLAQKRFAELAVQFTDAVDQESGLKPVADKFKLELRQEAALQRQPMPGANAVLANPKLLAELFSNDSLGRKQNLQAIDLGSSQLVSARVLNHSPARKQTLDEVRAKVREAVLNAKAVAAARDEANARLKQWQADPASAASTLPQPVVVSRGQLQNLPAKLVDAALRAPAKPLPAWLSVDLGDAGYAVVKLNQILPADQLALGGPARIQSQYAQLWSQAESEAYYGALKQRFKAQVSLKAKATAADAAASAASN